MGHSHIKGIDSPVLKEVGGDNKAMLVGVTERRYERVMRIVMLLILRTYNLYFHKLYAYQARKEIIEMEAMVRLNQQ